MARRNRTASYGNFGDFTAQQNNAGFVDFLADGGKAGADRAKETKKPNKPTRAEKRLSRKRANAENKVQQSPGSATPEFVSRRGARKDLSDLSQTEKEEKVEMIGPAQVDSAALRPETANKQRRVRDPNNKWHKRKRAMRRASSLGGINQPKKRHTGRKVVLVLVLLIVAVGGYYAWNVGSRVLNVADNTFEGDVLGFFQKKERLKTDANGRTNILIFGTAEDDEGGTHEGANLTDSIMVVSINQDTKDAIMVSIPRDLWVQLDGGCVVGYQSKINTVFFCSSNDGEDEGAGSQALMSKVSEVTGLDVQYYAHINFTAVIEAVNAVGGVEVIIDSDDERGILDRNFDWKCNYTCYYVKYPNGPTGLMDGEHALALMRARGAAGGYGLPESNFDRERYQQKVLTALFEKATASGTVFDINKVMALMDAVGNNLRTNINTNEVRTFMDVANGVDLANIAGIGFADPEEYVTTNGFIGDQSVVLPAAGTYNYDQVHAYVARKIAELATPEEPELPEGDNPPTDDGSAPADNI